MAKLLITATLLSLATAALAQSPSVEPASRPLKQYGAYKEARLGASFQMQGGPDKEELASRCFDALGGPAFELYQFRQGSKRLLMLADSSGEGQNFFPTEYGLLGNGCETIGKRGSVNAVAGEPRGSYHLALPILDGKGDLAYFLIEEKLAPGKRCISAADCKRLKGYIYVRELYKVTDKGLVLVKTDKRNSPTDADPDSLIPLSFQ